MKLLHVVPTYYPAVRYGGPIYSVHGLCRALVARGHEVHVFTTSVDGPGDLDVPLDRPVELDGVQVRYFPVPRLRRIYRSPAMGQALEREVAGFDLVHLHSIFLWPTWAAARAAARAGVPYAVAPRGALVRELVGRKSRLVKSAWLALIERRTLEGAAFLHATTRTEESDAQAFGYALRRIETVPNGLEIVVAPPGTPAPPAMSDVDPARRLLFLGRVNWKKGLDRLIPALGHAPELHLFVVGNDEEGYRSELQTLADRAGVARRVHFTGPLHGDDKLAALASAALLVLPSYSENFGNVILESWAAGRPVAVTREVGLVDEVERCAGGIVLPGEPGEMGRALAQACADAAALRRMGQAGRRAVEERFTWDAVAERMERAYGNALSGPSSTTSV